MLFMIVAIESQGVAKKSDSVGWVRDPVNVPGNMMKRAVMVALMRTNRIKSSMKTMSPMIVRPVN